MNESGGAQPSSQVTAEELNQHYAATSTDPEYTPPGMRITASQNDGVGDRVYEVFRTLDQLRPTAEGHDRLPAWFLRLLAPICSRALTYVVNLSVRLSCVPRQWKTAIIYPVPKVPSPKVPADYRPISVVPILSRMVERYSVQFFHLPSSPPTTDQG